MNLLRKGEPPEASKSLSGMAILIDFSRFSYFNSENKDFGFHCKIECPSDTTQTSLRVKETPTCHFAAK